MKKVILMLMLFAPIAVMAQKFGHVDTQAIMQSLPEVAKARGELEAKSKELDNALQLTQTEIERVQQEYEKSKSTMSATQQQETEKKLQDMMQNFQQQYQDAQQELQKAQNDIMQPIYAQIQKAIETVAKDGGYVYIMDISSGSVLYINDAISKDLTTEVKAQIAKIK